MRIVNEFAPGAILGGTTYRQSDTPVTPPAGRRGSIVGRLKAIFRLIARRRRAERTIAELHQLDSATLRDLGLADRQWIALEGGESIAASRRRTEFDYLLSASSRFAVRGVDAGL